MTFEPIPIEKLTDSQVFFELKVGNGGLLFLWMIVVLVASLCLWAAVGQIDEWSRGKAVLRPEAEIVIVKNETTGTISRRPVSHGDRVQTGTVLWEVDTDVLTAELHRLQALYEQLSTEREETRALRLALQQRRVDSTAFSFLAEQQAKVLLLEQQRLDLVAESAYEVWKRADTAPASLRNPAEVQDLKRVYQSRRIEAEEHLPRNLSELTRRDRSLQMQLLETQQGILRTTRQLHDARVTAPVDGTVEFLRDFSVGELALATEEIVRIVPDQANRFLLYVEVPEQEVGEIAVGQELVLRFASFPVSQYGSVRGRITYVPKDAETTPDGRRVFLLRGDLDTTSLTDREGRRYALRPGMTAEARIIVRRTPIYRFLLQKVDFLL